MLKKEMKLVIYTAILLYGFYNGFIGCSALAVEV
jgi:hypothetical protein